MPSTPEQMTQAFADAFNAGDIDQLVGLYEDDAVLAPEPGKRVVGLAAIREALLKLLAVKGKVHAETKYCMQMGEVALLQGEWHLSGIRPDGKHVDMRARTAEVARRQPDGTWRYIIDHAWQNDDAVGPDAP